MPKLFGIDVSADVYEANHHLVNAPAADLRSRKAVTPWHSEKQFQAAVFHAAAWKAINQPEYKMLFHIPNEGSHKQPGVKGGIPDLFLAVPVSGKGDNGRCIGGLFIELKIGSNKLSQAQISTIADLRQAGYTVAVIWDSVDEVMEAIASYLAQRSVQE